MHGVVVKGLKDFVVDEHGADSWEATLSEASLDGTVYVPVGTYDDEELQTLVEAAAEVTGRDRERLLRAFGRHLFPSLFDAYAVHVDPDWSALELVANVEDAVHESLRGKALSSYDPPRLDVSRQTDDQIEVRYGSERRLCDLAAGLIEGAGEALDDPLTVEEVACMQRGADRCELVVTRGGPA